MLKDFFKLNKPNKEIPTQKEFEEQLNISKHLTNILYRPDILKNIKIKEINFTNVSFSKTEIRNVYFIKCTFKDCLFIGTKISDSEFHNCTFENVNTHKIKINNTYINPKSFSKNFKRNDYIKSNIAVYLFQQLFNNAKEDEQSDFARIANYNFKKWQGNLSISKWHYKKPYPISFWKFLAEFLPNYFYRLSFGYGLRLRNFIITFLFIFSFFLYINNSNWNSYKLVNKGVVIEGFSSDSLSVTSNVFFTLEATTKLIDSQLQPTSSLGMKWLLIQSVLGFILLSALITIIINRFVK